MLTGGYDLKLANNLRCRVHIYFLLEIANIAIFSGLLRILVKTPFCDTYE
jgi:hypothetical protein